MTERQFGDPTFNVPVDVFIQRFNVENPQVVDILYQFPTLCYLLGNVQEQIVVDTRIGVTKTIPILAEGSGMFGLKNPEDVIEWRGIGNHIFGSVRHLDFIAPRLKNMTSTQRQIFADFGYDLATLDSMDAQQAKHFMFDSHNGRRRADEHRWYKVHSAPEEDPTDSDPNFHSYFYTVKTLREFGADPKMLEMMRVEGHDYLVENARANAGINPNFFDNVYDYCDWTFAQAPMTLTQRFEGLKVSGRQSIEILDVLQTAGTKFEDALKAAFGEDVFEKMSSTPPFAGEIEIRTAYAASAGLTLAEVYPDFATKYTS